MSASTPARNPRMSSLAKQALSVRPDMFAIIARKIGVSRQHVAYVAHGKRQSRRIEHALRMAIARRRYP